MRLNIFTIALNAMPWIERHYSIFCESKVDWRWTIVEGTAMPTKDTSWVAGIQPQLSSDGTKQYLDSLVKKRDSRVKLIRNPRWANKTEMVNAAIAGFEDGILLQVDADEFWTPEQLSDIVEVYKANPSLAGMRFFCRYFVGPDIVTITQDAYGNNTGEWMRCWRFRRGMRFNRHEPPVLNLNQGHIMGRSETRSLGLVFDHMSWVTPEQVKFKCRYYGKKYANGFKGWERLQKNTNWPTKLRAYLPWVDDRAYADKVQ